MRQIMNGLMPDPRRLPRAAAPADANGANGAAGLRPAVARS